MPVVSITIAFANCGQPYQAPKKLDEQLQASVTDAEKIGKPLFLDKCVLCHRTSGHDIMLDIATAPDRWEDMAALRAFIRNADSMYLVNKYAQNLLAEFNGTRGNHQHPNLTDAEVDAMINYVKLVKAGVIK